MIVGFPSPKRTTSLVVLSCPSTKAQNLKIMIDLEMGMMMIDDEDGSDDI